MLTPSALQSFELALADSLASTLRQQGQDVWSAALPKGLARHALRWVMFTISSVDFRLTLLLGFDPNQLPADEMAELGNLVCGALNRSLGAAFPLIAMSTPHMLDDDACHAIDVLRPQATIHLHAQRPDAGICKAILAIAAHGPIDFRLAPAAAMDEAGELELF